MDNIQIVKEAASLGELIVNKTASDLVLVIIVVACVFIPTYWLWTRAQSKHSQEMIKHQDLLIQVIKENAEAIQNNAVVVAGVKILLETHNDHSDKSMARLHERLDNLYKAIQNVGLSIAKGLRMGSDDDIEQIQRELAKNFRRKSRLPIHEQDESQEETV